MLSKNAQSVKISITRIVRKKSCLASAKLKSMLKYMDIEEITINGQTVGLSQKEDAVIDNRPLSDCLFLTYTYALFP